MQHGVIELRYFVSIADPDLQIIIKVCLLRYFVSIADPDFRFRPQRSGWDLKSQIPPCCCTTIRNYSWKENGAVAAGCDYCEFWFSLCSMLEKWLAIRVTVTSVDPAISFLFIWPGLIRLCPSFPSFPCITLKKRSRN